MSADVKKAIEAFREELAGLVAERGKDAVRSLLESLVPRIRRGDRIWSERILPIALLKKLKCPNLATPNGLQYICSFAREDLERMP